MKKSRTQSRNLGHESRRRRGCRAGLIGVTVRRPDGKVWSVANSHWDKYSRLFIDFADGSTEMATDCELESARPVRCCHPCGPVDWAVSDGKKGPRLRNYPRSV